MARYVVNRLFCSFVLEGGGSCAHNVFTCDYVVLMCTVVGISCVRITVFLPYFVLMYTMVGSLFHTAHIEDYRTADRVFP